MKISKGRWLRFRDVSRRRRQAALLAVFAGQYVVFALLVDAVTGAIASVSIVPVTLAALGFGFRLGSLVAVASSLGYIPFFLALTDEPLSQITRQAIPVTFFLVGLAYVVGEIASISQALRVAVGARERAEQEQREKSTQLESLIRAVPDTILLFDAERRLVDRRSGESEPLASISIDQGPVHDALVLGFEDLETVPEVTSVVEVEEMTVEIRMVRGTNSGTMTTIRDITDRMAAAERDRLARLVDDKNRFLATISHELRTPLTGIYGFAMTLTELAATDDPSIAELVGIIAEQSRDLSFLIEDLLVASRLDIEHVSVNPAPMSLRAAAESVIALFADPSISIEGDVGDALGDALRVRQILRNLVSNAIRYGGDEIRVTIVGSGEHAAVEVADDGGGIHPRDEARLFEAYDSIHSRPGQTDAVGIGLHVSRNLAVRMGGSLEYRREGRWTVFRLSLPTSVQPADAATSPA